MAKSSAAILVGTFDGTAEDLDAVIMKLHPNAVVDEFPDRKSYTIAEQLVDGAVFVSVTAIYLKNKRNGNCQIDHVRIQGSSPNGGYRLVIDAIIKGAAVNVLERVDSSSAITEVRSSSAGKYL